MDNEPNDDKDVQHGSIRTRIRAINEPIKNIRQPTMPTIKEEPVKSLKNRVNGNI